MQPWIFTKIKIQYIKIFNKLKKKKVKKEKFWINFLVSSAFISIVVGLVIFIAFIIKLNNYYTISPGPIELDKTGQVGDFIGGIVGAIWSLTGVLLFYATLRLQSRELKETRIHSELGRLTDIIYKQYDLFNQNLNSFILLDISLDQYGERNEYQGKTAVIQLRKRLEKIRDITIEFGEIMNKETARKIIIEKFAFIEINKNEFLRLFEDLNNHITTIRAVLIKEDIPFDDLNELKGIFFRNVGREFLNSLELFYQLLINTSN